MSCIVMIPLFAILAATGGGGREEAAGAAAALGMCCMYGLMLVLIMATHVLTIPFALRAGLAQDFAEGFKFKWAMDFLAKMWPQAALSVLFLFAVSLFILGPLSVITCFIGLYPSMAIWLLAQAHLYYQLYTSYLARGGEPIPLKPWEGPAPMGPAPI